MSARAWQEWGKTWGELRDSGKVRPGLCMVTSAPAPCSCAHEEAEHTARGCQRPDCPCELGQEKLRSIIVGDMNDAGVFRAGDSTAHALSPHTHVIKFRMLT